MVAFANVHLPSDPYGPDAVRDGASPEAVLALERTARLPFIQPVLAVLQPLIEQNIPVFLTGDFNAPSFTDWTEAMVGSRPFVRYPLDGRSAAPWSLQGCMIPGASNTAIP
jgi:hypothetical protein